MAPRVTRGPWAATFACAAVLFAVWYPGAIIADSWWQWQQAATGEINDWHPVGLTALMRATMLATPGLSPTAQLAIVFSLQTALFASALCLLAGSLADEPASRRWLLLGGWLYAPLWFALAFVYKDAWLLGAFLAAIAFLVRLRRRGVRWYDLLGFVACATLALLNRHNTILALALTVPGLTLLAPYRAGRWRAFAAQIVALAGLAAAGAGAALVTAAVVTERVPHFENLIALMDVFGIVSRSEEPLEHFADLATYREVGAQAFHQGVRDFRYNDMSDYLFFFPDSIYTPRRAVTSDSALHDLLHLAPGHAGDWLEFKMLMLMQLLAVSRYDFLWGPVQQEPIASSTFEMRSLLPPVRGWLSRIEPSLIGRPRRLLAPLTWLRWPVHNFILLVIGLVAGGLVLMRPLPLDARARAALFCLWAGAASFLPFLLLCPGGTFRYMMPSALLWWLSGVAGLGSLVSPTAAPSRG